MHNGDQSGTTSCYEPKQKGASSLNGAPQMERNVVMDTVLTSHGPRKGRDLDYELYGPPPGSAERRRDLLRQVQRSLPRKKIVPVPANGLGGQHAPAPVVEPEPDRKAATAGKEKDPVKQRAGRAGARGYGRNIQLSLWYLLELRGGTFEADWNPDPEEAWRQMLNINSCTMKCLLHLYAATWRARVKRVPPEEQDKLDKLVDRLGLRTSIDTWGRLLGKGKADGLAALARTSLSWWDEVTGTSRSKQKPFKPNWLQSRFRNETIIRNCKITADELEQLEAYMKRGKPKPKPKRKDLRLPRVLRACSYLRGKGQPRSVRNVQRILRERYDITACLDTVGKDLKAIRRDL